MKHPIIRPFLLSLLLTSCSFSLGTNQSSSLQNASGDEQSDMASNLNLISKKNAVTENTTYADDYIYGSDAENYYIAFHMGYMENVPLTETYEYKYYSGVGYYKEEYTTIETTQESLKTVLSNVTDTYHEEKENTTWNVNVSAEVKFPIKVVNIKVKASGGFQKSNSTVDYSLDRHEESTESCSSYTKTMTKSKTIIFDGSMPAGYYAYRFVGIVDQYNLVVVSKADYAAGTLKATVVPFGTILAYGFSLDYDPNSGVFKSNESKEKLSFDIGVVGQIIEEKFGDNSGAGQFGETCSINIGMFYDYPGLKESGHGPLFDTASNEHHSGNQTNPKYDLKISDIIGGLLYSETNSFVNLGSYYTKTVKTGCTVTITPHSSGQGCWGWYRDRSGYYDDQCGCLASSGRAYFEPLIIKTQIQGQEPVYSRLTAPSYTFVLAGDTTVTVLYEVPEGEGSGDWYIQGNY